MYNFAPKKSKQEKGKSKHGFLGSEGFRFQAVVNCPRPMAFMCEHGGVEGFVIREEGRSARLKVVTRFNESVASIK